MSKEISIILNDPNSVSEVFLHDLIIELNKYINIKIYYNSNIKARNIKFVEIECIKIPSYKSFTFLFFFIKKIRLYIINKWSLKKIYFYFSLEYISTPIVYFPFISLLKNYVEVLPLTKKNIFTSIRGTDITDTPKRLPEVIPIYQDIYKNISGVHYLSEELKNNTESYNLFHQNEHIIYQSIDRNLFKYNQKLKKDKLRLITIGRLHKIKGLEHAIRTCVELKRKKIDFEFKIIGNGSEFENIKKLIATNNLDNNVYLLGSLGRKLIHTELKKSNVYIHTHKVNGLSNSMLEGLFSGLSVVIFNSKLSTYKIKGLTNLIIETPKNKSKDMANKLEDLFISKEFGNKKSELDYIFKYFDIDENSKKYLSFLNS